MEEPGDLLLQRVLAAGTHQELLTIVTAELDDVLAAFDGWAVVPAAVRADPALSAEYVQRLLLVAQVLESTGHPEPVRRLLGDRVSNPAHRWHAVFQDSRALSDAGRHAESVRALTSLLVELDGATGPVVDGLRPVVLGALGVDCAAVGDLRAARSWTEQALLACRARGDTAGVIAYFENSQVLEALHLPLVDPAAGAVLRRCRGLVASAQQLSDDFEYASSNTRLEQALALAEQLVGRTVTRLHGKIYGLRGWNHHRLGDDVRARTDTETALAECQANGDLQGVHTYSSSLRQGWELTPEGSATQP